MKMDADVFAQMLLDTHKFQCDLSRWRDVLRAQRAPAGEQQLAAKLGVVRSGFIWTEGDDFKRAPIHEVDCLFRLASAYLASRLRRSMAAFSAQYGIEIELPSDEAPQ